MAARSSPANCEERDGGHGDPEVLGDRQVGQHRRVLVDDGDAELGWPSPG